MEDIRDHEYRDVHAHERADSVRVLDKPSARQRVVVSITQILKQDIKQRQKGPLRIEPDRLPGRASIGIRCPVVPTDVGGREVRVELVAQHRDRRTIGGKRRLPSESAANLLAIEYAPLCGRSSNAVAVLSRNSCASPIGPGIPGERKSKSFNSSEPTNASVAWTGPPTPTFCSAKSASSTKCLLRSSESDISVIA